MPHSRLLGDNVGTEHDEEIVMYWERFEKIVETGRIRDLVPVGSYNVSPFLSLPLRPSQVDRIFILRTRST